MRLFPALALVAATSATVALAAGYPKGAKVDAYSTNADRWLHAEVTGMEDSWVCVRFDGWPKNFDECMDPDNVGKRGSKTEGSKDTKPTAAELAELAKAEKEAEQEVKDKKRHKAGAAAAGMGGAEACSAKRESSKCREDPKCSWVNGVCKPF